MQDELVHVGPAAMLETDLVALYLLRFDRPATRTAYRQDLDSFFAFLLGIPTSELPPVTLDLARQVRFVEINRYLSDLEARGAAAGTRRRRLASIRGFFALLVNLGVLAVNPAAREVVRRIPRDSSADAPIIVLTKEQARLLVEAAATPLPRRRRQKENAPDLRRLAAVRDEALLLTMIHGCLRRGETALIEVQHIRPVGAFWVLDLPRTKGGEKQWIKLHNRAVHAVMEMKRILSDEMGWDFSSGPVFRSFSHRNLGERLSADGIYRMVCRTARRSGLQGTGHGAPALGAHTLRHTGCTLAIEGGASLKQVQAHARHKDLSTTMRYVHQRDRLRDSAADHISF